MRYLNPERFCYASQERRNLNPERLCYVCLKFVSVTHI